MNLSEERIRHRAYEIWEREGWPHGRDQDHWHQAAAEIEAEAAAPIERAVPSAPEPVAAPAVVVAEGPETALSVSATLAEAPVADAEPMVVKQPRKRAPAKAATASKKAAGKTSGRSRRTT